MIFPLFILYYLVCMFILLATTIEKPLPLKMSITILFSVRFMAWCSGMHSAWRPFVSVVIALVMLVPPFAFFGISEEKISDYQDFLQPKNIEDMLLSWRNCRPTQTISSVYEIDGKYVILNSFLFVVIEPKGGVISEIYDVNGKLNGSALFDDNEIIEEELSDVFYLVSKNDNVLRLTYKSLDKSIWLNGNSIFVSYQAFQFTYVEINLDCKIFPIKGCRLFDKNTIRGANDFSFELNLGESAQPSTRFIPKLPQRAGEDIVLDGNFLDWSYNDVIALDEVLTDTWNINGQYYRGRDLVALYFHNGINAIFLRVDLLEVLPGQENGEMDVYFLLDFTTGGTNTIPDSVRESTSLNWDVAVCIYDTVNYKIQKSDGTIVNSALRGINIHSEQDSMEIGIDKSLFLSMGGDNSTPMKIQAFTTKDMNTNITDALPNEYPWEDNVYDNFVLSNAHTGCAKIGLFHHGNQFIKNISNFVKDSNSKGFYRVPEIHERYGVPVDLHVSGTLAEAFQWWTPWFNEYLRFLHSEGIVNMVGGYYTEYIPKYTPDILDDWSMQYAKWYNDYYYGDDNITVCWIPERNFWNGYEYQVVSNGYNIVMVDVSDGYVWYCQNQYGIGGEYKVYNEDNGLRILFISNRGEDFPDNDNFQALIFNSYSGSSPYGLSGHLREHFIDLARNSDQNRYWLYMDDWEKACGNIPRWGTNSDNEYEASVRWMANHQWIQITPIEELAKMPSAGEVDINECIYFWMRRIMGGYANYDAWYYNPYDDLGAHYVEYNNWTAPDNNNTRMGDYSTAGTQIYKTWELIKQIPQDSPLRELAFKTFSAMMYETAWNEREGGENYIPYWEKEQAAHVRTAAIYYYVQNWLSNEKEPNTKAYSMDVDLDGSHEYILSNDKLFCIFESKGGKLAYAFDNTGKQYVGNTLTAWMSPLDAQTDAITDTTTNTHYNGQELLCCEVAGAQYLEGSKSYAFEDFGYENEIYNAEINTSSSTITFSQGALIKKTFQLINGTITANYLESKPDNLGVRISVSPDLLNLTREGKNFTKIGSTTGTNYGWRVNSSLAEAKIVFVDTNFRKEGSNSLINYVECLGNGNFRTALALGNWPISLPDEVPITDLPPNINFSIETQNLNNTTISGIVNLRGNAYDDNSLQKVEVRMDGGNWLQANISGNSWFYSWNTSTTINGMHIVEVRAYDGVQYSSVIRLFVNVSNTITGNPPEAPNLDSATLSLNNTTVKGTIVLSGTISPGINAVYLSIDGNSWIAVFLSAQAWSYTLDTTTLSDGHHNIYLKSASGNAESGLVSLYLTVDNIQNIENTEPSITITYPSANDKISGIVEIKGRASDGEGEVIKVYVSTDRNQWREATGISPWTFKLDTTKLKNGRITIYARAEDNGPGEHLFGETFLNVTVANDSSSILLVFGILIGLICAIIVLAVIFFFISRKKTEEASKKIRKIETKSKITKKQKEILEAARKKDEEEDKELREKFLAEKERIQLAKGPREVDSPEIPIPTKAKISIPCDACESQINLGSMQIVCSCGKYYHEKCAEKVTECIECGKKLVRSVSVERAEEDLGSCFGCDALIKKDSAYMRCFCGERYHLTCAAKMGECPNCGTKLKR